MGKDLEIFLAELYSQPHRAQQFAQNPSTFLAVSNLSDKEKKGLREIDVAGLIMASQSFHKKRSGRRKKTLRPEPFLLRLKIRGFYEAGYYCWWWIWRFASRKINWRRSQS